MENIITVGDKKFIKYISKEEITAAATRIAATINEEYKNDTPILLVTLNGAMLFAAEVIQQLTISCRISGVKFSSYHGGLQSSGTVKELIGINEDIEGQRVLILEDIVDTGNTYECMLEILKQHHPKDIKIATMTFKQEAYKKDFPIDFIGMKIQNKFIIGHGLDYDGLGRNYPDIYELYQE